MALTAAQRQQRRRERVNGEISGLQKRVAEVEGMMAVLQARKNHAACDARIAELEAEIARLKVPLF